MGNMALEYFWAENTQSFLLKARRCGGAMAAAKSQSYPRRVGSTRVMTRRIPWRHK
jgi:hypothetical protein